MSAHRNVVLTVAAVALAFAAAGAASPAPADGNLFFVARTAGSPGDARLYTVHADGTGLSRVDDGAGDDRSVSAAPGGGGLVVSRDTHEQCDHVYAEQGVDLFAVAPAGGDTARLTNDCPVSEEDPSFSPSGAHVVYDDEGDLWVRDADGSNPIQITCNAARPRGDYRPSWSPDGSLIAFDHELTVAVIRPDGEGMRTLAPGTAPSFAPSGARLAYAGTQGIHTIGVDGSGDRQLTSGNDVDPAWSPDGTSIVFLHLGANGSASLRTVDAHGGAERTLVSSLDVVSVAWASPATAGVDDHAPTATAASCVAAPAQGVTAPVPEKLEVAGVSFAPRVLHARRPFAVTVTVRDGAGRAVPGVLVRALGEVVSPVRTTGAHGTATLRVAPTKRLVLGKGRRLYLTIAVRTASGLEATRRVSIRTG